MGQVERLSAIKDARSLEVIPLFLRTSRASSILLHFFDRVSILHLVFGALILAISARFKLSRVVIWVPILGLPISPDKAAGLLKIGSLVDVLLAPLNLSFHAATCLLPLAKVSLRLLISPLVRQLLVLVGEPHLLQLLLLDIRGRIVLEVVAAAFELILCRKLNLLLIVGVEGLVGRFECGAFRLCKCTSCVGEFNRATNFC